MDEEIAKFEGQEVLGFFRPMGFFREGALLGLFGVFSFVWFYGNKGDKYLEKYSRLGCVLSFLMVFLSTSRSSILAVLTVIAVSFLQSRLISTARKPRYATSFFLIAIISNISLVFLKTFDLLKEILPRFTTYTLLDIYSLSVRLFLWEYFYEVFAAYAFVYKLFGNGLGAMGASTESSMSKTAIYMVGDNAYIWLGFNFGILGLLLWLGLNLFMYAKGSKKIKNMIIALAAFGNFSVFFESYLFQLLFPVFLFIFFVEDEGSSQVAGPESMQLVGRPVGDTGRSRI